MGLFDTSLFDSNSSSDSSGLLGRLIATLAPQYQAGQGFPDQLPANAQPTSSTPAILGTPNYGQAQNIPIGNYQMPAFGGRPAPMPVAPALQPQAAPPAPAEPAGGGLFSSLASILQPAAPGAQSPSLGDRLSAGFQSFAHGHGLIPMIADGLSGFASGQRADPEGAADRQNRSSMKAQYDLLAPIVGPQKAMLAILNPAAGKEIYSQAFGASDDKLPASAAEYKFYKSNLTPGETPVTFQKWLAIKGTDPTVPQVLSNGNELYHIGPDGKPVIDHKNSAGTSTQLLSEDGVNLAAERILNGEKGVTTGFSRSIPDMMAVQNKVAEIAKARGIDATGILSNMNNEVGAAAAARTSARQIANMETYGAQTEKAIDIAEQKSAAVPRGKFVPINRVFQSWQSNTSDPALAALGQSLETLTQEYSRAVGGGHGTVSDKLEAREYLSKAQSHEALVARLNVMRTEIQRARESAGEAASGVQGIYRSNIIRGGAKLPDPGAAASGSTSPADPLGIR